MHRRDMNAGTLAANRVLIVANAGLASEIAAREARDRDGADDH